MQRRLIVNADDFGLDPAINRGIAESFRNGIVTSASLLACGIAFDEAVRLAKEDEDMGVGIHLALNEEAPVLSPDRIMTLIDPRTRTLWELPVFLRRYLFGKIDLAQVRSELKAQMEKAFGSGLKFTHLDGHKHIHMLPGVLNIVLELAKRFGISRLRVSKTGWHHTLRSTKMQRAVGAAVLTVMADLQLGKVRRYGVDTPDYSEGVINSGGLDEKILLGILNALPLGNGELFCHPGLTTNSWQARYKWKYNWASELKALTSPAVKTLVKDLNIQLIHYDEI